MCRKVPSERRRPGRPRNLAGIPRVVWLLAGASLATVLIATRRGAGLTPDSTYYLSAAGNLARGKGLVTLTGASLTVFPPGLSLVAALGDRLGLGAAATVRVVNATALGMTVVLAFLLLRRHVRHPRTVLLATFLVAVSAALLASADMAMSEPVFIVVSLLFLLAIETAIQADRAFGWLVAAAVLTGLAFAFRYSGLALLPAGGLAILIGRRRRGWQRSVGAAVWYSAAASIGAALVVLRNRAADGTLMGPRQPATESLVDVLGRVAVVLGSWVLPSPVPTSLQGVIGVTVIGVAIVLKRKLPYPHSPTDGVTDGAIDGLVGTHGTDGAQSHGSIALMCFVGTYLSYLVVVQLTTAINELDSRLLSPVYVPLVVLATSVIECAAASAPSTARRRWAPLATGVIAVFFLGQFLVFAREARAGAVMGKGYATAAWQSSDLTRAVRAVPTDADLVSNDAYGLWAAMGREPIQSSPQVHGYRSATGDDSLSNFARGAACRATFLAWFRHGTRTYQLNLQQLEQQVDLETVTGASDGALYRVRSRGMPVACS